MVGLESNLLTLTVFFPLLWAIAGVFIPTGPKGGKFVLPLWTLVGSLVTLFLSLLVYQRFSSAEAGFQMIESAQWLPSLGISYALGIDGISLWLVMLTTVLTPIAILGSFNAVEKRVREYYCLLLALETGMLGAFVSLDIFLF